MCCAATYATSLERARGGQRIIFIVAAMAIVVALGSLKFIGTEFMPKLDEGSLVITSKKLPGISLHQSVAIQNEIERHHQKLPGGTGCGEQDGPARSRRLRPWEFTRRTRTSRSRRRCRTSRLQNGSRSMTGCRQSWGKIPGVSYEFTQPMEMRMDETITGTRGDLALMIFAPENGGSLDTLEQVGHQAQSIIAGVKGASETQMELIEGSEELQIQIGRAAIARYGLNVSDIPGLHSGAVWRPAGLGDAAGRREVPDCHPAAGGVSQ